jgi:hypothetical protein
MRGVKAKTIRMLVYGDWAVPRKRLYRSVNGVRHSQGFRLQYLRLKDYFKEVAC